MDKSGLALPPGPTEPAFLQAIRFGRDPIGYMARCAERYGDCFRIRLPGDTPKIACSHPEDVRRIFALKPDEFTAAATDIPTPIGPGSLLFLDGQEHLQDRKLMAPMLLGDRLSEYGGLMAQTTEEVMSRWSRGQGLALHPEMREISLAVIVKCIFGVLEKERTARLCELTAEWLDLALSPTLFMIGLLLPAVTVRDVLNRASAQSLQRYLGRAPAWRRLPWQRLVDLKAELMAALLGEIRRCREEGDRGREDVLALMVAARYEDGSAPSDARIVDQLITMLIGGHETTANALCWALRYMLPRADVMAKVHAELEAAFPDGAVTADGLRRLPYLDCCIEESMRLLSVAVAISRVLKQPLALRKYVAPAGSNVWACPHLTQLRPELWPEPSVFRPERFMPDATTGNPGLTCPRESNYPFGGGRRRCVGMTFANYEMRVVLARLLLRTSLSLAPDSEPRPQLRGISFTPGDTLRIVMH